MIDKDLVLYVARLAHLRLSEAEIAAFTQDLGKILDYVHKLDELDTSNIAPTAHAVPLPTKFRNDQAQSGIGLDKALANAPEPLGNGFGVPKIIE
ncbi:MAG: Asp-tRNA(Asn)/Glu-tRNA(Gln) amidotransferase subunit GatC [Deltaproteobacteria bacterium]|nr:Asp-tRNA(Asn)/Glu-tRNA(Gln) amidotransferase subunit GatC [Deltaproteobacteria bacterium]